MKNHLFETLDDRELAEFIPFLHLRTYEKNEVIFFRNDPSQALYIIKDGEVSVNLDIEDGFEELARFGPADSFGDEALLENSYRVYNAVCASEKCQIFVIATTNILETFESNFKIKAKIMGSMAKAYSRYTENLFKSYQESFGFFELGKSFLRRWLYWAIPSVELAIYHLVDLFFSASSEMVKQSY